MIDCTENVNLAQSNGEPERSLTLAQNIQCNNIKFFKSSTAYEKSSSDEICGFVMTEGC